MAKRSGKSGLLALAAVGVLAVVVVVALLVRHKPVPAVAQAPKTAPATAPSTAPETKPAKPPEPQYVKTYMDVVRRTYPAFPATQPLAVPLDLSEAARLVLKDPVFLDLAGSFLWITRADAAPTEVLLKSRPEDPERIIVTREHVLYAHWMADGNNEWRPYLVTPAGGASGGSGASGTGAYELVCHLGRRKIGGRPDYRWDRAASWNDKIVVPTATGVSIFSFPTDSDDRLIESAPGPEPVEQYQDLVDPAATTRPSSGPSTLPTAAVHGGDYAEPQTLLDWRGLLAWIPWDPGKKGGRGAARYLDGKWTILSPAKGWPEKVLHLVPLRDGSVIQFVLTRPGEGDEGGAEGSAGASGDEKPAASGGDKPEEKPGEKPGDKPGDKTGAAAGDDPHTWPIRLGVTNLDHAAVDRKKIVELVAKLGSDDQAVRDAAYNELTQYGPEIWPVLKELYDDAAPEAQVRMKQLLRSQSAPLLGGMVLLGDRLQLVCRDRDGSAVFFTEKGVQTAGPDGEPVTQAPAWLAVRPAHAVQMLDPRMVADLRPDRAFLTTIGEEWIVTGDVRGPQRFIGNSFVPLLRKNEAAFADFLGEDRRGRWVFRPPPPGPLRRIIQPAAGTGDGQPASGQPSTGPATAPAGGSAGDAGRASAPDVGAVEGQTLIIDPTLPNLIPRLPVWTYATADEVGWDKDNWPAVRQLNHVARLTEGGWDILGPDAVLYSKPEQVPAVPGPPPPPATQPGDATAPTATTAPAITVPTAIASPAPPTTATVATAPTTAPVSKATPGPAARPATGPATAEAGTSSTASAATPDASETLLWVDRDGTRYYDGTESLRVVSPSGAQTTWTLPASAAGKAPVHLVKTEDGRLFLFNEPGRVVRIKPTPGEAEPFVVEATFSRNIPNVDAPTRVWLDPAGRIIIAFDDKLAILFPSGYIPPAIRALISNPDEADEGEAK